VEVIRDFLTVTIDLPLNIEQVRIFQYFFIPYYFVEEFYYYLEFLFFRFSFSKSG